MLQVDCRVWIFQKGCRDAPFIRQATHQSCEGRPHLDPGLNFGELHATEQLLGDLLHEDAVVALCCHAGVRKADERAEPVAAQIALAAAALAACSGGLLVRERANKRSGHNFL